MIFIMPHSTQLADRRNEIRIIFHTFNHMYRGTLVHAVSLRRKNTRILITKARSVYTDCELKEQENRINPL